MSRVLAPWAATASAASKIIRSGPSQAAGTILMQVSYKIIEWFENTRDALLLPMRSTGRIDGQILRGLRGASTGVAGSFRSRGRNQSAKNAACGSIWRDKRQERLAAMLHPLAGLDRGHHCPGQRALQAGHSRRPRGAVQRVSGAISVRGLVDCGLG